MLFPTFQKICKDKLGVQQGQKVILGVSGGVDSIVLACLFVRLRASLQLELHIAHVNHNLRGRASTQDEAFVRAFAKAYGVPCHIAQWQKPAQENMQDAARNFRYEFFVNLAHEINATTIATAHQQEDQAETVLLHFIRGTGLKGLIGMKQQEMLHDILLLRPLLFATKAEILGFAQAQNISYRFDESNDELTYRRNKVRHQLLPLLQEMNPRIIESICRMSDHLAADEQALQLLAREYLALVTLQQNESIHVFSRAALLELPQALRSRLLVIAFEQLAGDKHHLSSDHLRRMNEICLRKDGAMATYALPAGWQFTRKKHELCIHLETAVRVES